MEKLDEIVVGEVARQVLDPGQLTAMLDAYLQLAATQADGAKALLAKLRHDHTAAVAGIARLLELVEKGLMEAEDPAMRERLVGLKLQRDRITEDMGSDTALKTRHDALCRHAQSRRPGRRPYRSRTRPGPDCH